MLRQRDIGHGGAASGAEAQGPVRRCVESGAGKQADREGYFFLQKP
jgi:hypothetical protein